MLPVCNRDCNTHPDPVLFFQGTPVDISLLAVRWVYVTNSG